MKKGLVLFGAVFLVSGCSTIKDAIIVKVPIPVKCESPAIVKPVMPFTDGGKSEDSIFDMVKKLLAEIEIRKGYEDQLNASVQTCQKLSPTL